MTRETADTTPHSTVGPDRHDPDRHDPDRRDPDHLVAADLATAAGRLLLAHRADAERRVLPAADVRAAGDRLSHEYLVAELARVRPADAVLSEEGADHADRLTAERVWIVDPLDGTREFGEAGRTDWAVHVALVERGDLVAGAVALPALGVTYSSADTAPLSGTESPVPARPRVLVSRTRRPEAVMTMASALRAELIEMGSAGAKAMAVVRGDADVYAHTGGQYEWDSAAPVAVARAAGLHVSRLDGSPLVYNQPNPWLPDLLVCRPELAADVLEVLAP